MNKIVVFIVTVGILVAVFLVAFSLGGGFDSTKDVDTYLSSAQNNQANEKDSLFSFDEEEYDFGVIKQSGGIVEHKFSFTYMGEETITITGVPTSCACTSANISKDVLNFGDKADIVVLFDPNLHAEPEGKFFKTISMVTEPELFNVPELKIWVEIDLDLGASAFKLQSDHDDEEEHDEGGYHSVTPAVFSGMLDDKDFTLIDVHVPEQDRIAGTDLFVPYNQIASNANKFPSDRNAKVVVYCRSGGMSRAAAYALVEMGYTNVYDLVGGKNAYDDYIE